MSPEYVTFEDKSAYGVFWIEHLTRLDVALNFQGPVSEREITRPLV